MSRTLDIYQLDAFAEQLFSGNPAAVIPLDNWLSDELMQRIAEENNLSETAFIVARQQLFEIRWFTPTHEVALCGHATLAAAFVIFNYLNAPLKNAQAQDKSQAEQPQRIEFSSLSGPLFVERLSAKEDSENLSNTLLQLDFPAGSPQPCDTPKIMTEALGATPDTCFYAEDYIAVFNNEQQVANIEPNFELLKQLDLRGVMITSVHTNNDEIDFVSRFFAPNVGINEDPVTGSSFTQLCPYWSAQLNKKQLSAQQISKRSGRVYCQLNNDRVLISGCVQLYLKGVIYLD